MTRKSQAQPELLLGPAALGAAVITIVLVVWINMDLVERAVARDQEAHEILAKADAVMAGDGQSGEPLGQLPSLHPISATGAVLTSN